MNGHSLGGLTSTLGLAMTVVDKSKRWLSLSELEKVRLSIYPLNARRLGELTDRTRQNMQHTGCSSHGNGRRFASAVLTSLLIGLDIRIPLRQRNLREMLWNPRNPAGWSKPLSPPWKLVFAFLRKRTKGIF